jgi:surfactin synthase thioesterase subunit
MFNTWGRALGPRIEVVPVEVENRERFATLSQLVEVLHGQLRAELDGPHVFFGHSFGALLAYRLACLRAAGDFALPRVRCSCLRMRRRIFRRRYRRSTI